VVYNESVTTTSVALGAMRIPVQVSQLTFAEATVVDLMATAESASSMLLWFRTLVPWMAIGFGGAILAGSAATVAVRSLRKARADKPAEQPKPTYI
jgi:hypothetical protein